MFATFSGFTIEMTLREARAAAHPGLCDPDVLALSKVPKIARQLARLDPDKLRLELREYGAWSDEQLADHEENLQRTLWLAADDIRDQGRGRA